MTIKKALAIPLFALMAGFPGGAAQAAPTNDLWIHVAVRDARDAKVSINLPVAMIESLAGALPTAKMEGGSSLRIDDEEVSVAELRRVWRELRRHPEATFLTIEEDDANVRVARQGAYLVVHARDRRKGSENVQVRIPATVVDALLSAPGDRLDVTAALRALARHGEGELVTVTGEGETVRVWVDRSSSQAAR